MTSKENVLSVYLDAVISSAFAKQRDGSRSWMYCVMSSLKLRSSRGKRKVLNVGEWKYTEAEAWDDAWAKIQASKLLPSPSGQTASEPRTLEQTWRLNYEEDVDSYLPAANAVPEPVATEEAAEQCICHQGPESVGALRPCPVHGVPAAPAAVSDKASRIALHVHRHYSKHFLGREFDLDGEPDSVLVHSVHVQVLTEEIAGILASAVAPD